MSLRFCERGFWCMSPTTCWFSWCWRHITVFCFRFAHVISCRICLLILPHFLFPLGCKFPAVSWVQNFKRPAIQLWLYTFGQGDSWYVDGSLGWVVLAPSFTLSLCGMCLGAVVLGLDLFVVVVLVRSSLCRSSLVLLLGKGVETFGLFLLLRLSVYRVCVCVWECVCACACSCFCFWFAGEGVCGQINHLNTSIHVYNFSRDFVLAMQ